MEIIFNSQLNFVKYYYLVQLEKSYIIKLQIALFKNLRREIMNICIAENIKNLRKKKEITQEQLAEILNISNVAVSKWERGETYPDISLLPVLAKYFDVTIDELMGYKLQEIQKEIESIENEYWRLWANGKFKEASILIHEARQTYIDDYKIMYLYMHDIMGGRVANKSLLIERKEELLRMCDNILCGCTIEKIRLEAINIKAKILYALGKKQEALDTLKVFPDFIGTVGIKSEELFEYNSEDSQEWVRRNLYSLAQGYSVKLIKKIWFDNTMSAERKIINAEKLGDAYTEIYKNTKETAVLLMSHKLWESLSIRIIGDFGKEEDIVRIKNKELQSAKILDELSSNDKILKMMISEVYSSKSILERSLTFLENAPQRTYIRLRNSQKFNNMLIKFK